MLARSRRTFLMLVAATLPVAACDSAKTPAAGTSAAPAVVLPPFQQEIASMKAELTLPGAWRYAYRMVDRPDTAFGAYRAVEFLYTADSALKVPPRLLLIVRAFKKPAWEKVKVAQQNLSRVLAEHGDDVYAFSIVTSNPYAVNTPSALRVDQMMLALTAESSPFKLEFPAATR